MIPSLPANGISAPAGHFPGIPGFTARGDLRIAEAGAVSGRVQERLAGVEETFPDLGLDSAGGF